MVNNIVICADVPPTVVDIHDCTDHMAAGGKKDAEYLAGVMEEEIVKFAAFTPTTPLLPCIHMFHSIMNIHNHRRYISTY